jgi:thymidylate synthase ThyX
MINAEIIADSINREGNRLTTFVVVFPRIVLAEFNTHRMLSKNSASSRAIPFKKMVEMAKTNPFVPTKFQKDHSGMQGTEYFEGKDHDRCVALWLGARDSAVEEALKMHEFKITKQLVNRTLEAFQYQTVIVTGSEWENFFALRAHPAAEIHIAELAHKMLTAYNESKPKPLRSGEWHIPFGDHFETTRVWNLVEKMHPDLVKTDLDPVSVERLLAEAQVAISTARCARVSYLNFEGKDDYDADLKLHDMLKEQGHWSPFEHCALARHNSEWSGNFKGFTQYRKTFLGENKRDERVERWVSQSGAVRE